MSVSTAPAETSLIDRCAASLHDAIALLGRVVVSWIFLSSGFTKLTDVAAGMRVHLQLKGQDIMALRVENPVVVGFLSSISEEKRTVEARAERQIASYTVAKDAKITMRQAADIALKARPGKITDRELERENGGSGLRYSFDITSHKAKYEVGVDAQTGAVLENSREEAHPD